MFVGALSLVFLAWNTLKTVQGYQSGRHPLLKASHDQNTQGDMSTTLTALSAMLWGLVVVKAKQGLNASDSKDHATVGNSLRKAAKLIVLIMVSACVKFVAELS